MKSQQGMCGQGWLHRWLKFAAHMPREPRQQVTSKSSEWKKRGGDSAMALGEPGWDFLGD